MEKYISTEELHRLFIACNQRITTDTRKLEERAIFFALKGTNFDANQFAQKAIDAGCAYAVVDNIDVCSNTKTLLVKDVLEALQELAKYHRQQLRIPVISITGSNGKTTNKELIHAVLSKKYNTYATKGNLNNHIGVPLTLLSIKREHEIAIVEMGANHQGEIDMLSRLSDPDFGLITNIGKAHLEGFGGEEGVKKGKTELYRYLKKKNGKIFINGNDPVLTELSDGLDKIYYGENNEFDVYGQLCSATEFVEFKWNLKNQELDGEPIVRTKMFGHYNFINLLCAACIGHYFGVEKKDINSALGNYTPEMNRSQVLKTKTNSVILDAYNANPSSMNLAIENFSKQSLKRKVVILGDMFELGEYSSLEHHAVLDNLSKTGIEKIILVGIQFSLLKNQFPNYQFFLNTDELKKYLSDMEMVDSTILIKGSRGMQLEKIVECL
ncbi:MAG: UDP-N-acetylmuramoyl-tripeptide--D-alanyl-D-alanine ligase [Bacteroidota bacterium]|jgi:UDP-N-acetylmuramoyl-tripeptide--D-alanyl-D-alanine ligase|nr:UDP-N-acetylmuramoyl-tripeptide--D-alanyl-D-alanine ligase [Bacteroidota bacterium]